MKSGVLLGSSLGLLSACSSSSTPPAKAPSLMIIDAEVRGGISDGPRAVTEATASAGYRPSGCCGLDVYISRVYLGRSGRHPDALASSELTDIGLGLTAAATDRLRFRLRGGLAALPPHQQTLMRGGVGADAAVLVRVFPWSTPTRTVGTSAAQLDWVIGGQAWSLASARTSAGSEGGVDRTIALTTGLRLAFDYGVDLE